MSVEAMGLTPAERQRRFRQRHRHDPVYRARKRREDKDYLSRNKARRLKWHGRHIMIDKQRIGVCNWCRAVLGFDTKQTQFHHEQYDEHHPEKHTIELCAECHKREGVKHISKERRSEIGRLGNLARRKGVTNG